MASQKPHSSGACQLCDMFENVGHWGPPVGRVTVHVLMPWPEDEVYCREADSEGQDG